MFGSNFDIWNQRIIRLTDSNGQTVYISWVNACDAPGDEAWATLGDMQNQFESDLHRFQARGKDTAQGPDACTELTHQITYIDGMWHRKLDRLIKRGHSFLGYDDTTGEQFVKFNRAGPKEGCVGIDRLVSDALRITGKDAGLKGA